VRSGPFSQVKKPMMKNKPPMIASDLIIGELALVVWVDMELNLTRMRAKEAQRSGGG